MDRKWYRYPGIKIQNLPPNITEAEVVQLCGSYGTLHQVRFPSGVSLSEGGLLGRSPGSVRPFGRRNPCGVDRNGSSREDASRPFCIVDFCREEDARMCESCLIGVNLRNYRLQIKGWRGIPLVPVTEYQKGYNTLRESLSRKGRTQFPRVSPRGKKGLRSSLGCGTGSTVEAGQDAPDCGMQVREGRGRKGISSIAEPAAGAGGGQGLNPVAPVFPGEPVIHALFKESGERTLENTVVEELSQGIDNRLCVESVGTTGIPHDGAQTGEVLVEEGRGDLVPGHEGIEELVSYRPQEPVPWETLPKGCVSEDHADRHLVPVHPVPTGDVFISPMHKSLIPEEGILAVTVSEPAEVSTRMSIGVENLHEDLPQEPVFTNPVQRNVLPEELMAKKEFLKDKYPIVNQNQVTQEEQGPQVQEVPSLDETGVLDPFLGNGAEVVLDHKDGTIPSEVMCEANDGVSNLVKGPVNSFSRDEVAVQESAMDVCVAAVKAKYGPTFYDCEESVVDLFSLNDTKKPALKCWESTEDPHISAQHNLCLPANIVECQPEDQLSKSDSGGKCSSRNGNSSPPSVSSSSPSATSAVNLQRIPRSPNNLHESLPQQMTAGVENIDVGKGAKKKHKKALDTKRGGSNASSGASAAASGTGWKCPDPHCGASNATDLLYCANCKFPKRMNESSTMSFAAAKGRRQGIGSPSCRYITMGWFVHAISPIKFFGWTTMQRQDKVNLARLLQNFMDKKRQVPQQVALDEIYGLQVEGTWERVRIMSRVKEECKEKVQEEGKEEKQQEDAEEDEEEVEEKFLVTLVDNGPSVIARKEDLALLPKSTKDFTPLVTEFALKHVKPLHKADPYLLEQGQKWLTERLGGGKELELHCIGNPDYKDVIVQVSVGGCDISQEVIERGFGQGHVPSPKRSEDLMSKVNTLTFEPKSDNHWDVQSAPPSPESIVKDLYSNWEEPFPSGEDLLEGEEQQQESPSDKNLPDPSGQMAKVDICSATGSPVVYEEPAAKDSTTTSVPENEELQKEEMMPQASSQPSMVLPHPPVSSLHPCVSSSQPCVSIYQGYISPGQPCPSPSKPFGSPSHSCPPPPLLCMPSSQGYAPAFQSCLSPQLEPCVPPQAPLSPHQHYTSPPPPLVSLPHPHVSPTQQLTPLSSVHSSAPQSQPCLLPSQPSSVLAKHPAQEPSQGLIQPSHPSSVSLPSKPCSFQVQSTSPCPKASSTVRESTTKARYNFKGKKGPGRHPAHPQRPQGFIKEPLFGWHRAPAVIAAPVPRANSYERPSSEQEAGMEISMSQIPSHREVCLYQHDPLSKLDDVEKRYTKSSSVDPKNRVLHSNPMDDRDVTVQHLLGCIAACREEMKLLDRQGAVNKMHHVLERVMTTMKGRLRVSEGFRKFESAQRALDLCLEGEQLQTAATEDKHSQQPSAIGRSHEKPPEVTDCRWLLGRARQFMESASLILQENEGLVRVCQFIVEVHRYSPEERRLTLESHIKEVDKDPATTIPGGKKRFIKEVETFEKWKDDYTQAKKAVEASVERLALVFTDFGIAVVGLLEGREALPYLMADIQVNQLAQDLNTENQLAAEQETQLELIRAAMVHELREQVETHHQLEDICARLHEACQNHLKEGNRCISDIGLTDLEELWLLGGGTCGSSKVNLQEEEGQSLYELVQQESGLPCMMRRLLIEQIIQELKQTHKLGSVVGNLHPRHIKIKEGTLCLVTNSSGPVDHLEDEQFQPPEFNFGEEYPSSDVYRFGKLIEWLSGPKSSDDPDDARVNDEMLSSMLNSDPRARPTLAEIEGHVWFLADDNSSDGAFEDVPQSAVFPFWEGSLEISNKQKCMEEAILNELEDSDEGTSDDSKEKIRNTDEEGVPPPEKSHDEPANEVTEYHEEGLGVNSPKHDNDKSLRGSTSFQKARKMDYEDILVPEDLQCVSVDCSVDLAHTDDEVQCLYLEKEKGSQEHVSTSALEEQIISELEEPSCDILTDGTVPTSVQYPASLGIDEDKGSYQMDGLGTQVVAKEHDAPGKEHTESLGVKEDIMEAEDVTKHMRHSKPTVQICSELYSGELELGGDAEEQLVSSTNSIPEADLHLATGHNSPPCSADSFVDLCRGAQGDTDREASILAELQDTEEDEEEEVRPRGKDPFPCETRGTCFELNPHPPEDGPSAEPQISDKEVNEDEIILILEDPERPLEL